MFVETLHTTRVESLMPLALYAEGFRLTEKMALELRVKNADEHKSGSDAFLDKVLNYQKECQAIYRFMLNFNQQNHQLSETELEQSFDALLTKWLTKQIEFTLSENGCEKYLQVQPSYEFTVIKNPQGHEVLMKGLDEYGDLSLGYIEENRRVGKGLQSLYTLFASDAASVNLWAGILSPTEEYQDYVSTTDVINLWHVVTHESNRTEAVGKYLILNQVLNTTERRFIHNLFYGLNHGIFTIEELQSLNSNQLISKICTDRLMTDTAKTGIEPEYQTLITCPNSFTHQGSGEDELYTFTKQLDSVFTARFGKKLISTKDMQMYPLVRKLAQEYIPEIKSILLEDRGKDAYYRVIRRMIYHCQALWALTQEADENLSSQYHFTPGSYEFMEEHLRLLADGIIFAGFESGSGAFNENNWDFSFNLMQDGIHESNQLPIYSNRPLGWEKKTKTNQCKSHGEYEGDSCQKCKAEQQAKKKTVKRQLKKTTVIWPSRGGKDSAAKKNSPPSLLELLVGNPKS